MNALDLNLNADFESGTDEGDRESHTQLISRRIPSAPWVRQPTTFLEQALAESVLIDGGLCVIQEIDADTERAPQGAFDVVELTMGPRGDAMGAKRARYVAMLANVPMHRRRRTVANDMDP